MEKQLEQIAELHLNLSTLKTRNLDELDFSSQAVWDIKAALEAAYAAGASATPVRSALARKTAATDKLIRSLKLNVKPAATYLYNAHVSKL